MRAAIQPKKLALQESHLNPGLSRAVPQKRIDQLEKLLWPNGFRRDIWMIVDAARDRRIYGELLSSFYSRHSCLFSGPLSTEIQLVAPYLVQLEPDDPKGQAFLLRAWGNSWGVFVKCDTRLETLRKHLRTLLLVKDEKGSRMMFRYYDPRVLRIYLPTCRTNELETVFGPINNFFLEDNNPDAIVDFSFSQRSLTQTRRSLIGEPSSSLVNG